MKELEEKKLTLVTDLTNTLNKEEKLLLSKGPKFALKKAINNETRTDVSVSFCRLAYQIRWRYSMYNTNNTRTNTFIKYTESTRISLPEKDLDIERRLQRAAIKISDIMKAIPDTKFANNLSGQEKMILKTLKSKPFVYLPSDKGMDFCIIEKDKYKRLGENHLNNTSIYASNIKIKIETISKRINTTWKEICRRRHIPNRISNSYQVQNPHFPHFYHLIKTHNSLETLKIRPIVSSIQSPAKKIM